MELKTYLSWITGLTTASAALLIAAILMTNPTAVGPVGVTFCFVALFLTIQGASTLSLYSFKSKRFETIGPYQKLTSSARQGLLIGGVVTITLALSSLRQLSLRDFGLMVILAALVELFFRARR